MTPFSNGRLWKQMTSLSARCAAAALAFAIGMGVNLDFNRTHTPISGTWLGSGLTLSEAQAGASRSEARRVARRTARRTTRRVNRRNSLPAGCPLRGLYYYCGGVYYQNVVQDGATVYIVVTP